MEPKQASLSPASGSKAILRYVGWGFELVFTLLYHEMLKRNTLQPLQEIIDASDEDTREQLLREWSRTKEGESSYIQLAVCNGPIRIGGASF